jgi:hypothetical protein
LVAVLVVASAGVAADAWRRRAPGATDDVALAVVVVLLWLLPLANQFDTGLYRREATLLPAALLLRHLPWWALAVLTAAAVAVWYPVAGEFFRSTLI